MIFEEQISRKPNHYPWTKDFIESMHNGFWTSNEFSFQSDIQEFKTKLTDEERDVVVKTLSAIGQIEVAVKKFWAKLGDNLPHPSLTDLGYVMANVECFSKDTEILTPLGWKLIKNVQVGEEVYQYNSDLTWNITKVKNTNYKLYKGVMYEFGSKSNNCLVTPEHDMVIQRQKVKSFWELTKVKAKDLKFHSAIRLPKSARITGGKDKNLTAFEKLYIAIQADGTVSKHYLSDGTMARRGSEGGYTHQIRLKKKRKILRLIQILNETKIKYSVSNIEGEYCIFYITMPTLIFDYKDFSWVNLCDKSANWCEEFIEELFHWDGSIKQRIYFSKYKQNVDFCQHIGILAGFNTTVGFTKDNRKGKDQTKYRAIFSKNIIPWKHATEVSHSTIQYDDYVYCLTVDSGIIITRRNGKTFITGNCIHNDAYERLLSVLGLEDIFEENLKLEVVQGRVNYLRKYLHKYYKDSKKQYVYSLILFTLFIENVSLFSQFYIILWFNRYKNVLKDTGQQVDYTKKEELIHAQVGVKLINTIRKEHPELFDNELMEIVNHEANEAYKAEARMVDWIIGDFKAEKLNSDILKAFIKKRLNESLLQIGFDPVFPVDKDCAEETLWFDEDILGNSATDFFHKRPTEYSKKAQSFDAEELF